MDRNYAYNPGIPDLRVDLDIGKFAGVEDQEWIAEHSNPYSSAPVRPPSWNLPSHQEFGDFGQTVTAPAPAPSDLMSFLSENWIWILAAASVAWLIYSQKQKRTE